MINNIINSKFFAGLTAAVALTSVMANASIANALIKTHEETYTLGLKATNITKDLLSIKKFDDSFGLLKNVKVRFDGQIVGEAEVESRDAEAQTLTFTASGELELYEATNTLDNPLFYKDDVSALDVFEATAYDGTKDYAGTSGTTFEGLKATFSGTNIYTEEEQLKFFTGNDKLEFLFSASTNSKVTGAANISSDIFTQAGASVTVTYEYDEVEGVPEPSAVLGLGLLAGICVVSKKKLASNA